MPLPPFDPNKPFTPVEKSPGAPPFNPDQPFDEVKKKDNTASTSLSTPPQPGSVPSSQPGSATGQSGSPSTNPLDKWTGSPEQGTGAFAPPAQASPVVPGTQPASTIPNFALFHTPFATSGIGNGKVILDPSVSYTEEYVQGSAKGQAVYRKIPVGDQYKGMTYEQAVTAERDKATRQTSYNQSLAIEQQRNQLLETQPGTPEYNAKNFPGVALPVQKEDPLEKSRQYYDSYLSQYDPAKRADYIETVRGQQEVVDKSKATGFEMTPLGTVTNSTEELSLQKTQAQFDQEALSFAGQGAYTNFNDAATTLSVKYKPQMDAAKTLNDWPVGQDGKPVIADQQQAVQYQSLVQQIQQDPGFISTFSQATVSKAHLDEVHQAAQTYLNQYPQWRDQFNLNKQSEREGTSPVGNAIMSMVTGGASAAQEGTGADKWMNTNILNPSIKTVASAIESLAYIPKVYGSGSEYGWTDKLYDNASMIFGTKASQYLPTAGEVSQVENPYTGQQEQIFKEDFLPGLTSSVTQMALILAGGEIPGVVGGTAEMAKLAQVAGASTLAMNHFYEAGKQSGMSESEAQKFSVVSGIVSGSFMAVNPIGVSAAEGNSVVMKTVESYAKTLAENGSVSMARQAAMKSLANEIVGVNMVGVAQKLSEYGTNYLANTVTGVNLDTGNNIGKDMWDVVLMSTIMGAGFGALSHGKDIVSPKLAESQPYLEALYTSATDPLRYKDALLRMHDSGAMTDEKMAYLNDQIDRANTALQTAPESLSAKQKAMMLPELMKKQDLLKQLKVTDNALKPVVESQIEESEAKIRSIAGVKSEAELALEKNQDAQDMIEHQDLALEKAALGDLTPEQNTRYEELQNKFNPQPAQDKVAETINPEQNATTKIGEQSKGDQLQHQNGDQSGQTAETGSSDSNVQSGEISQQEVNPTAPQENVTPAATEKTVVPDVAIEDNSDVVKNLDTDIEATKQVSLGKIDVKRKAVERRIDEALNNKQITQSTADQYHKAVNDIADGRKKAVKESANKIIDNAAEKILQLNKKLGGGKQYVTAPDGTKVPIVHNGILDVERLVKKSAEILKAAVSRGIDMNIAINNMMAAIKEHPAFKAMDDADKTAFQSRVEEEYKTAATQIKEEVDAVDVAQGKTVSRAMESPFVDQAVKDELARLGTDYLPVKNKIAEQDARRIVEFFKEAGETTKLEEAVRNLGNDMQLDSRGAIMVELIKDYTAESKATRSAIENATTPEEIETATQAHKDIADKLASLTHHAGNIGTVVGRYMQYVHKALKKIFEGASEDVVRMMIDKQVELRAKEAASYNQKNVGNLVKDINGKIVDGKIDPNEIYGAIEKHLPGFSPENHTELLNGLIKTVAEKGKVDHASVNGTYENVLAKEIMSPALKEYVDKNIGTLREYDKKVTTAHDKINSYKDAVEAEKKAYADAIAKGEELTADQKKTLSEAVSTTHDEALSAAKEMESFEMRAQEAQENISKKLRAPRNIWNTMASMMTGNMLRVKSLAVNMISYVPTVAFRGIRGAAASMLDWVQVKGYNAFQKLKGSDLRATRANNLFAQVEGAMKYGAGPGHAEAFRRVLTGSMSSDLGKLEGHSTINFMNAWHDLVAKRNPAETRFIENRAAAALEATVGVPADIVFRLLQLGDAPPRKMAEAGKLLEIAKQKGLTDAEQLEFMFFPDEQSRKISQEFGKKATYQNDSFIADKMRGALHVFSAMAEKAGNRHLAGAIRLAETTVTPFVKTPLNIIGEVAMYSNPAIPLVITGMKIKKAVEAQRNGNTEAATRYRGEANQSFAKALIGMAVASMAISFVKKGLMTPGYDRQDSEAAKLAKEEGVKYSSMNVSAFNRMMAGDPNWDEVHPDDYWMNYGKMGAYGMVLSVWAETIHDKEIAKDGSGIPMSMLSLMGNAGLNTVSTSFDQSFLTGTSTLMDAMHSKDYDRIIPNTMMAFTNIALPGTMMDISKSQQDAQKVTTSKGDPTQTYLNKLKLGTFQGDDLQDKVGLFGETISSAPRGTTSVIYNVVDPYGFYQPGADDVTSKVIDFYTSIPPNTEGRNKIIPPVPSQTIRVNGQSVMLTDKEFHDFKVMVGNARAGYVRPYLTDGFGTDEYQDKVDMLTQFYRDGYKDAYELFVDSTPRLAAIENDLPEE